MRNRSRSWIAVFLAYQLSGASASFARPCGEALLTSEQTIQELTAARSNYISRVRRQYDGTFRIGENIILKGVTYKIIEFLGSGAHGWVYQVQDAHEDSFEIKLYNHEITARIVHRDLIRMHSKGLPSIVEEFSMADPDNQLTRYRFVYGLSVSEIRRNRKISTETKGQIAEKFVEWWNRHHESQSPPMESADGIVYEFATSQFYWIDPF